MVLLLNLLTSLTLNAAPLTILIDPGHGGIDRGATIKTVHEADITLAVSLKLRNLLNQDKRFKVIMSRSSDSTVSLGERARVASQKPVDVMLSIHVNSSPDSKAQGAEFYFQNQLPSDQESMYLAHRENDTDENEKSKPLEYPALESERFPLEIKTILSDLLDTNRILNSSQLSRDLKNHWDGSGKHTLNSIRQAPFFVLTEPRVPSALVELGFLTNTQDFARLTNPEAQARMAADLQQGLIAFKDSIDKRRTAP